MNPQSDPSHLAEAVKAGDLAMVRSLLNARPELIDTDLAEDDEHRPLHYAVLAGNAVMVKALMEAGADARKGIYPHRDATGALTLARDRGMGEIVNIIEQQEQARRESMSCPNATVAPVQEQIDQAIINARNADAIALLSADESLIKACDRQGASPLHVAAGALNIEMVSWLLDHRANVLKQDMKGLMPLDCAVMRVDPRHIDSLENFSSVAKLLRDHGSPLSVRSAIALGDPAFVRSAYVENPASYSPENSGGALSIAIRHERLDMVRILLDLRCDPDERHRLANIDGEVFSWGSPLWLAALKKRCDIAELLLKHKADANAEVYASGGPLFQAYGQRDHQMIELLRRHGAIEDPITVGLHRDAEMARQMLEGTAQVRMTNHFAGDTIAAQMLWGAACGGDAKIVQMCLQHIDWRRDDPRWFTMLEQPLRNWNRAADAEMGLDTSIYTNCFGLILNRCDPNIVGRFGARMLHRVAALNQPTPKLRISFAQMLLDAGADYSIRDEILKSTPLGWAARWGRDELVKLLLDRGAPADEIEAEAWATPLAWAMKMNHQSIAKILVAGAARSGDDVS